MIGKEVTSSIVIRCLGQEFHKIFSSRTNVTPSAASPNYLYLCYWHFFNVSRTLCQSPYPLHPSSTLNIHYTTPLECQGPKWLYKIISIAWFLLSNYNFRFDTSFVIWIWQKGWVNSWTLRKLVSWYFRRCELYFFYLKYIWQTDRICWQWRYVYFYDVRVMNEVIVPSFFCWHKSSRTAIMWVNRPRAKKCAMFVTMNTTLRKGQEKQTLNVSDGMVLLLSSQF